MKNIEKIKTYKEIKNITIKGKKHVLKSFIIYETESAENKKIRIGILLSRKFGNAVKRNFARRRIMAAFNLIETPNSQKKNFVFIPRVAIMKIRYEGLIEELKKIIY